MQLIEIICIAHWIDELICNFCCNLNVIWSRPIWRSGSNRWSIAITWNATRTTPTNTTTWPNRRAPLQGKISTKQFQSGIEKKKKRNDCLDFCFHQTFPESTGTQLCAFTLRVCVFTNLPIFVSSSDAKLIFFFLGKGWGSSRLVIPRSKKQQQWHWK